MKLIKVNGQMEDYLPMGKKYSLEELQKAVLGLIEIVDVPRDGPKEWQGYAIVVNEEGLLKGFAVNKVASEIAMQTLVGRAVLCKRERLGM